MEILILQKNNWEANGSFLGKRESADYHDDA